MKWDWRSAAVAWWAVAVALTGAVAGDERIDIAVGMSGSQPIAARVTAADWDHFTKRTRVLLVGDGPRSAKSIEDAWEWFHRDEQAQLRKSFALSAVPNAAPIKKGREAALRGFPPPGPAYKSPWSVENQYLWRWIGMHAPDLVVVVDAGDSEGALVASTGGKALRSIRRPAPVTQTPATQDAKSRRLGAALAKYAACETGVIDAVHLNSGGGAESIQVLLGELQRVGFQGPSAARLELQKRLARAPVEVAQQLSQHYGRDLKQVVYIPALALVARLRLGELTGDDQHALDVKRIVAPYYKGEKPSAPKSGSGLSGHLIFAELAAMTTGEERQRYIELTRAAADLGLDDRGRAADHMPFHSEMSDALFMGGPILTRTARLTGNEQYTVACRNHLRFMRRLVWRDGVYRHSPLDEAAWGRGNGFPALGLAMCLSDLPEADPRRDEFLNYYREHLTALRQLQDPSGCWRQVVDRPGSYRELTSTCMITYAMVRGIRRGWLSEDEFGPAVSRAWKAILTRAPANGRLVDVCTGTGKQQTLRDYYNRTAILGPDARGGAMAMLISVEMAAWRKEQQSR